MPNRVEGLSDVDQASSLELAVVLGPTNVGN